MFYIGLAAIVFAIFLLYTVITSYSKEEDMNRHAARRQVKVREARVKAHEAKRSELIILDDIKDIPMHRKRSHQEQEKRHVLTMETIAMETQIVGGAKRLNLDPVAYVDYQKKLLFDQADLDKRWKEIQQDLESGFQFQMQGQEHLRLLQKYIFALIDERKRIQNSNDLEWQEKVAFLTTRINTNQEAFHVREAKLLSAYQQEAARSGDEDSDGSGEFTEAEDSTEEQSSSRSVRED